MEKLFKYLVIYKISFLTIVLIIIFISSFNIKLDFKLDSIIIVFGNFIIAMIITGYLSRKHKKDEIELDHCIKDISEILIMMKEMKNEIYTLNNDKDLDKSKKESLKKEIISKSSLCEDLITMLQNHSLVNNDELESIKSIYKQLEETLTNSQLINDEWFDKILKLNRHLLKLKSSVIKKYRNS